MNDVFPIENGDVPVSHVSELRGVVAELPFFLVIHEVFPCRKLTYPWGKEHHRLKSAGWHGIRYVPRRVLLGGCLGLVNVPTLKPEIIEKLTSPSCFNILFAPSTTLPLVGRVAEFLGFRHFLSKPPACQPQQKRNPLRNQDG